MSAPADTTAPDFVLPGLDVRALARRAALPAGLAVATLDRLEIAGLAATFLATIAAYLVDQRAMPARRTVDFLCVLPAAVPGVFLGIGYLLAFNRPGIPLSGTAAVLVIAFTFANLPFGYQVIRAGLSQIDRNLADAAADLGASRFRVLWDVHLRLVFRRAFRRGRPRSSAASRT
jgi:ABC-type Fe3+ transport system permease subunit